MSDKKSIPSLPSLVDLLKAGAHFGHQASKWHPKMEPYLFGKRNGIHIINLEKTAGELQKALEAAHDLAAQGKVILFLGTKRQAREIVKNAAEEAGMPHVTGRWLGGTITNFAEIKHIIDKLNDYRSKRERGEFEKYTKRERLELDREIEEMEAKVGGIATLSRLPDAMYIIDIKHEKTAVAEAEQKNISIFALLDTNVNPEKVSYGIPANDDAVKTIALMTDLFAKAVKAGREKWEKERAAKKAEVKDSPTGGTSSKVVTL